MKLNINDQIKSEAKKEFDEIKVNKRSINTMLNYIYTGGNYYYQRYKIKRLDNHIVLSDKNFKF